MTGRYGDMNMMIKQYDEDLERITSHFVSVLEEQGVTASVIRSLMGASA